jgi:IclR family KDG regulon transcriptional repressor
MAEPQTTIRHRGQIGSVLKALAVLELVGDRRALTLTELVAGTGYPKSTMFRLLGTLTDAGFLVRRRSGEYGVGVKVWRLGASAVGYDTRHERTADALRTLVDATGETAHYSVYESGFAVYVEKLDGLHPVRAYTSVGGRSPAYASATGKVLLANESPEEIARVSADLVAHTDRTLVGAAAVRAELERVRLTGYAVNRGEWRKDVWGVAAPVRAVDGPVIGAIGVSGPRERLKPQLKLVAQKAVEVAARLSEESP